MKLSNRYRIVRDHYRGFEVQTRKWWWPFWDQIGDDAGNQTNTSDTLEEAKKLARWHAKGRKGVIEPSKVVCYITDEDLA